MFEFLKIKICYVKRISTKINHLAYKNKIIKQKFIAFKNKKYKHFPSQSVCSVKENKQIRNIWVLSCYLTYLIVWFYKILLDKQVVYLVIYVLHACHHAGLPEVINQDSIPCQASTRLSCVLLTEPSSNGSMSKLKKVQKKGFYTNLQHKCP